MKRNVIKLVKDQLGEGFDVEKHFTPDYNPWDQRFCLAPDGDFFEVLKDGSASIVTDHIDRFTETGIRLKSGEEIEADLIIPATGLDMQLAGGAVFTVDRRIVQPHDLFTYRGMMLSNMPNMALAFGYTNASWTLKVDLTFERVCRMLNHMKKDRRRYRRSGPARRSGTGPAAGFLLRLCPARPAAPAATGQLCALADLSELYPGHAGHPLRQAGRWPHAVLQGR